MLNFSKEIRKKIAYEIVKCWERKDEGKTLLDTYFSHGRCTRITCGIMTQEAHDVLQGCVDKTFTIFLNILYEDIASALDDWLDVYKIFHYEEFIQRQKQVNSKAVRYGT